MERLRSIFEFSEEHPLIFSQADFWIFFAVVYFFFSLLYRRTRLRSAYLFLVSVFFYYKTSGLFVGILLFSTVNDFWIGKWLAAAKRPWKRKLLLIYSLLLNLGVLSYFKYAYFFTDSFNAIFKTDYQVYHWLAHFGNSFMDTPYFTVDKIILPVGISFYTFQTLSYTIDVYRRKLAPLNRIIDFGFFVTFFPQLVAGPIVRASEFVPQIHKDIMISREDFGRGIFLILKGLIKKMIFADYIALNFLDRVFDTPEMFTGFENVMAMIGYSLQIYGDFSGYTDIAIGLALLMGFVLPVNFNSPYKAIHCGDFWKRWHISLSTWLRDYLYIPLGGNQQGTVATYVISGLIISVALYAIGSPEAVFLVLIIVTLAYFAARWSLPFRTWINTHINIMLTMLIGGLWHGASWKFVIWGGLNGLGILVSKAWRKISPYEHAAGWPATAWKILITFLFITFTRIYFRSESMDHIRRFYHQVWSDMHWDLAGRIVMAYPLVFLVMGLGYLTHWAPQGFKDRVLNWFTASGMIVQAVVSIAVGVLCYQAYSAEFQPFIYFDF